MNLLNNKFSAHHSIISFRISQENYGPNLWSLKPLTVSHQLSCNLMHGLFHWLKCCDYGPSYWFAVVLVVSTEKQGRIRNTTCLYICICICIQHIHAYTHTHTHTHTHTYCTYIHTYIHSDTYIHIHIHIYL